MVRCLELDHLTLAAEAITQAALTRLTSRGTHCRADLPETNDLDWLYNVEVRPDPVSGLHTSTTPVVTT